MLKSTPASRREPAIALSHATLTTGCLEFQSSKEYAWKNELNDAHLEALIEEVVIC
jgi:hypothetical protein